MNGKLFRFPLSIALLLAAVLPGTQPALAKQPEGADVSLNASGPVKVESGAPLSNNFLEGTADINITATDTGGRVTPLPPHDWLIIDAAIQAKNHTFHITVREPMVEDPLGRHTTWWGVGLNVDHHGRSGIGTSKLPAITAGLAAYGIGNLSMDGAVIAVGVPVHVMTAEEGIPGKLELDVGDPELALIPGIPDGFLRVIWPSYQASINNPSGTRYLIGSVVILVLLVGALFLNRREMRSPGQPFKRGNK